MSETQRKILSHWEQTRLRNNVLEQHLLEESKDALAVMEAVKLDRPELLNFPEVQQAFELFTEAITLLDSIPGKKTNEPKHRDKIGDLFRQGWELLEPLGQALDQELKSRNT